MGIMGETDLLSGQVRGVVARAGTAGFEIRVVVSDASPDTYVVVGRRDGVRGLGYFRISRHEGGPLDTWLKFRHWPLRRSSLAELRSILTELG